ncbi:hypothetical protein LC55x_1792 [Lysobacter capsici]|nr:hypothetical protein LC55x_1792 [Lysobacter capsici]
MARGQDRQAYRSAQKPAIRAAMAWIDQSRRRGRRIEQSP